MITLFVITIICAMIGVAIIADALLSGLPVNHMIYRISFGIELAVIPYCIARSVQVVTKHDATAKRHAQLLEALKTNQHDKL